MNFEIVKLYYKDIYEGWTTKEPEKKSYDFGYFLKIEGKYFKIGIVGEDEYYVTEEEE